MRNGRGDRWQRVRRLVALAVGAACLLGSAGPAGAGDLRDTVRNLYGGDGIILQPTGHAPHFTVSSLQGLDTLNSALASSLGLFAFNSAVSGFTFDVERGLPVRTQESFGPLLADRAPTLGQGKLNVGLSYTRIDFTTFQGKSLKHLGITFHHEDSNRDGTLGPTPTFPFDFETDAIHVNLRLRVEEDVFALFGTYGLTAAWDVGVVVPIVRVRLRADAEASIVRQASNSERIHQFGPGSDSPTSGGGGEETGIGDVVLRTKYNFLKGDPVWPDLAVVGEVKLPTGSASDLLGTGETNVKALLVASRAFGIWTPHTNLGFELSTEGSSQYNLRYILGVDARLLPSLTAAAEILGRWEPWGDGIGDHTADLAVGLKWNLYRSLLLSGNVQIPLNRNEGLRADVIWSVGLEYTF